MPCPHVSVLCRLAIPCWISAAMLLVAAPAAAQTAASLTTPFPEGFALNPLEPAPAGDRFFLAPDATASGDPRVYVMGFGDYAYSAPLSRTDTPTGQTADVVSKMLYLHASASLALADRVLFNVDMPFAASQSGDAGNATPSGGKLGDLRLGARLAVAGSADDPAALGVGIDVWAPTGSSDNLTGDGKVRARPQLIASGKAGPFAWAANVGYLFRKKVATGSLEIGPALTFGAAAGLLLFDDKLQIGPELQGSTLTSPQLARSKPFQTEDTPVHGILGARLRISDFVLGVGAGPGMTKAPGTAPRFLASIAFVPTTHVEAHAEVKLASGDRDNDGVADDEDACPDTPGVATPDGTTSGCPEKRVAPIDTDGDGVADKDDACPDQAGTASDDSAQNGCPVKPKDSDGDGVPDDKDACPDQAGTASDDSAQNGCPVKPKDSDGDGISDDKDACPDKAGVGSEDAAQNGCPAKTPTKAVAQAPAPAKGDRAIASFIGFRKLADGTSRVFVQLTRPTTVLKQTSGMRVVYTLKDARVVFRNNKNPLLTVDFDSPVASARLAPAGKDVKLVIELRRSVTPSQHVDAQGSGANLVVDFPAR